MNNIVPHHSFIAKDIYFFNRQPILIPELWIEMDSTLRIDFCIEQGFIHTIDADSFKSNSEFVISDSKFFEWLKETELLSYTIFSSPLYRKELPTFFDDLWVDAVNTESMKLLGWTVNKYTEPAYLYGLFPITPIFDDEEKISNWVVNNKKIINQYGLINSFSEANKISKMNTSEDEYEEVWRPLAIYVDKDTFGKIEKSIYLNSKT